MERDKGTVGEQDEREECKEVMGRDTVPDFMCCFFFSFFSSMDCLRSMHLPPLLLSNF